MAAPHARTEAGTHMGNLCDARAPSGLPGDQVIFRYFDLSQLAELVTFQQLLFQPADRLQRLAFAHLVGHAAPRSAAHRARPRRRREILADVDRRMAYQDVMQAALLGYQKWSILPAGARPRWEGLCDPDGGVYAFSTLADVARSTHVAPDRCLYVQPLLADGGQPNAALAGESASGDVYLIYTARSTRGYEKGEQRLYIDLGDFLRGVLVSPLASRRFQDRVYGAMRAYAEDGVSLPGRTAVFQ